MSKDARKKQFREISLPSSLLSYAQILINVALMPEAGAHAGVLDGQVLLVDPFVTKAAMGFSEVAMRYFSLTVLSVARLYAHLPVTLYSSFTSYSSDIAWSDLNYYYKNLGQLKSD